VRSSSLRYFAKPMRLPRSTSGSVTAEVGTILAGVGGKGQSAKVVLLLRQIFGWLIPVLIFLGVWEFTSRLWFAHSALFPPPSQVAQALVAWHQDGELWRDVSASYWRMLVGFLSGGAVGVGLGMLTGRSRRANVALGPVIQILRPLPPVAIIPLVIVWLGIGDTAKIFSTAFAVFFPVWINTHLGAAGVAAEYLWSAQLLERSKIRTALAVVLPATLPAVVAGFRTAIAIAFVMVYVTEIAGASAGIGYQISVSHLAYRIDRMMAALVVLAAAGALADLGFAGLVRLAFPWLETRTSG